MQKIDYVDAPQEKFNLKGKAGSAVFSFLSELATAKEEGKKMPKLLDKIAGLALTGKREGISIAQETVKEQFRLKLPLIIMGIIIAVLVGFIIFKKR